MSKAFESQSIDSNPPTPHDQSTAKQGAFSLLPSQKCGDASFRLRGATALRAPMWTDALRGDISSLLQQRFH